MKKLIVLALVLVLALSMVACGGKKADGIYTAQLSAERAEDNHGWQDTVTIEYKGGKVASATFESYDADGNKKSETTPETYPMEFHPTEWIPMLNAEMVAAGESKKMDGIAGATHASESCKELFAAIEKDGKPGETITVG